MRTVHRTSQQSFRSVAFLFSGVQFALWLLAVAAGIFYPVSSEAKSIDRDFAIAGILVFLLTGAPAILLAYVGRWLWLAVLLALAPFLGLLGLMFRVMTTDRGASSGGLYPNMLAACPPFQIDANLGYVAALAECLLQSHGEGIDLLPCVPSALTAGRVRGLVARPGVEVSVSWSAGNPPRVEEASFSARHTGALGRHRILVGSTATEIDLAEVGRTVELSREQIDALNRRRG